MKILKAIPAAITIALLPMSFVHAEGKHWAYAGHGGPAEWGTLDHDFAACKLGKLQSPIDIRGAKAAELPPIKFDYKPAALKVIDNGHTVQVNYAPGSSITLDGTVFELKQFHFHAPSENQIRGKSYPLEGHLVHADKDGNLAVVAVMFREGAANKALAKLWPLMPTEAGAKTALPNAFAAAGLLPTNRAYYRFSGSLTTPPCSEGVRWLVMKAPVSASAEQIEAFTHVMHHPNNRPVQAVNGRTVLE